MPVKEFQTTVNAHLHVHQYAENSQNQFIEITCEKRLLLGQYDFNDNIINSNL